MDTHDMLNPNLYLGIGEKSRVDDFSDQNLPFGWKDRTASQYADLETLTQRPKGDDWRSFELESMYAKVQHDLERKAKTNAQAVSQDVPLGWGDRHNALSAQELMNSGSAISVAVGEVIEKDSGNTEPPSLVLNRSKPIISSNSSSQPSAQTTDVETNAATVGIVSSSKVSPVPPENHSNARTSNCNDQKDIIDLITKYHKEQQQVMGQLASLVIDISGRLTALEYKLDDHLNHNKNNV